MPLSPNTIKTVEIINFYTVHKRNPDITFNLEGEESAGTIQIFNLLLILLDVCKKSAPHFLQLATLAIL